MQPSSARARALVGLVVAASSLAAPAAAWAHAEISPAVAKVKATQLFTLAVPTEKEALMTTKVELTPPSGFGIDSFVAAPGWKRDVQQTGSGENAEIQRVTWSGGKTPTEEDAVFQFLASPDASKSYTFAVRQTYSDGSVVDWTGPESSDTPSPAIEAKSSLGSGGNSTLSIIGLAVSGVALVAAAAALVARGDRPLA